MKKINIFICHSFSDTSGYNEVLGIVGNCLVPVEDYSCTKDDAIYHSIAKVELENAMMRRIDLCDIFILILTERFFGSRWMQFEEAYARNCNTPVLPVLPVGHTYTTEMASRFPNTIALDEGLIHAMLALIEQN